VQSLAWLKLRNPLKSAFIAPGQVKIIWALGFHVLYVAGREIITAEVTKDVRNAKGQEKRLIGCLVTVVKAKDM
jgi:hypothetical protein